MASLIGTIRSSLGDQWWVFKAAIAVYVLYFAVNQLPKYIPAADIQYIIYAVIGMVFLGYATVAMYRNINNQYPLYPGFTNILDIILKSIGSFFAVLTGLVISCAIVYLLSTIPVPVVVKNIFYGLALLFMMPFMIIPLVLYAARGKFTDAFRLGIIFGASGNFIMNFIVFLIQFAIIFVVSYICLFFFLQQMFGVNHITTEILKYIYIVISFYVSMVYFSDLYDDVIPVIEVKK